MQHSIIINEEACAAKKPQLKQLYIVGNKLTLYKSPDKKDKVRFIKIGISNNPSKRLKQLQTGCPFPIKIIKKFEVSNAEEIETALHNKLSFYNSSGEWFMIPEWKLKTITNYVEQYILNPEIACEDCLEESFQLSSFKKWAKKQIKKGILHSDNMWDLIEFQKGYSSFSKEQKIKIIVPLIENSTQRKIEKLYEKAM